MNSNNICEIFNSLQGEGREIGIPATFIRFNQCNKRCVFCDTEFEKKGTIEKNYLQNIIFSGGEPFLFKEDIIDFMNSNKDKKFYGETNGSLYDEELATSVVWAISPKTIEDIESVKKLMGSSDKNYIKLVFNCKMFTEMYNELKEYKEKIWIQPMTQGYDFLELQECINFVAENNLKISPRLHLLWRLK